MGELSVTERALAFECEGERLIGVLATAQAGHHIGVVIVVGGPQYRAGGHRQFVLLARHVVRGGFPVLRFDRRGMGDSGGEPRTFEDIAADIRAAIDALFGACPRLEGVVLLGLCDGASAAIMYAPRDKRVAGIVMLNPWILSSESFARSQIRHHYVRRLLQPAFWRRLLKGEVDVSDAVRVLARAGRPGNATAEGRYQDTMAAALASFKGNVLLVLSGQDPTAKSFEEYCGTNARWRGLVDKMHVESRMLPRADHTFSTADLRTEVERLTLDWLTRSFVSNPIPAD